MLILALILSALNAITGTARSLHQMSMDGQFPRFFQHTNSHGVPDRSMIFNVVCSIIVVFFGGAVEIYTFSNVGYLASFVPVLIGYYLLRKDRPERAQAVQAARVDEVPRARAGGLLHVHLLLRRHHLLDLRLLAGRPLDARRTTSSASACSPRTCPLYWWRKRDDAKTGAAAPMTIGQQAAAAAAAGGGGEP